MRADVLPELRCPTSGSPLALDVATLPVRTVHAPYGAEIREGLLASVDGTMYPIIAGVAILMPQPLTFIASNTTKIVARRQTPGEEAMS